MFISSNFTVVECRIRLFPTLISKIKWVGSLLPLIGNLTGIRWFKNSVFEIVIEALTPLVFTHLNWRPSNWGPSEFWKYQTVWKNESWGYFSSSFQFSFWALCLISKWSDLEWTWNGLKGKWVLISERKDSFGLESDWLNWFKFSHKLCLVHDFSRRNNHQNIIFETNASSWSFSHSDSRMKNVSFQKKNSTVFMALE